MDLETKRVLKECIYLLNQHGQNSKETVKQKLKQLLENKNDKGNY